MGEPHTKISRHDIKVIPKYQLFLRKINIYNFKIVTPLLNIIHRVHYLKEIEATLWFGFFSSAFF